MFSHVGLGARIAPGFVFSCAGIIPDGTPALPQILSAACTSFMGEGS